MAEPDPPVGGRRTRRGVDEVILAAYALGKSRAEIAVLAGVGGKTVQRFLADPVNRAEADRRRREQEVGALAALRSALRRAAEVLAELLEADHPAAVRLRAASELLGAFRGLADHVDLAARLDAVERAVSDQADRPITVQPPIREVR